MDRQRVILQQVIIRCLPSARTVKAIKRKGSVTTGLHILLRGTDSKQLTYHVLNGNKCLEKNRN